MISTSISIVVHFDSRLVGFIVLTSGEEDTSSSGKRKEVLIHEKTVLGADNASHGVLTSHNLQQPNPSISTHSFHLVR